MKKCGVVVATVASVALLAPLAAVADSGLYAGLGLGSARYDISASDWGADSGSLDDSDTGYKLFVGWDFNPYVGLETAYVDLGETSFSTDGFEAKDEPTTLNVAVVGRYPFADRFSVHAKLGVHRWTSRVTEEDEDGKSRTRDNAVDWMVGAGGMVRFGPRFALVGEWERFTEIVGTDVDFFSLSGRYNF